MGAYAGKEKIMRNLAPLGGVYQASTFAGNPVVMSAGIAVLSSIKDNKKKYRKVNALAGLLVSGIRLLARENNVDLCVSGFGSIFSLKFSRPGVFSRFYRELLKGGVYFAPSEYEANFLSFAHTKSDVLGTLKAAGVAFCRIKKEG